MNDNVKFVSLLFGFFAGYIFFYRPHTITTSLSTGEQFTSYDESLYDKFRKKITDIKTPENKDNSFSVSTNIRDEK